MSTNNKPSIASTPAYDEQNYTWYTALEGNFFKEDTIKGTSGEDSMDATTIPFLVPEGQRAVILGFLNVDDWGTLTVTDKKTGAKHLEIRLTPDVEPAGPRGGHAEWSKMDHTMLPAGQYDITVTHLNTTYPEGYDPRYNVSKCRFRITATTLPDHDAHEVTGTYTGIFNQAHSGFKFKFPIKFKATCSGSELQERTFGNLQLVSCDDSNCSVLNEIDNKIYSIKVQSVKFDLIDTPIYDTDANIAMQKVLVTWIVRSWDHQDPNYSAEGTEYTVSSSSIMPGWATIQCKL